MDDRQRGRLFVALAAVAWSSAGLLQRELSVDTATQTGGRAVFAAFGLLAYVVLTERGGTLRSFRVLGLGGAGVVVLLAISSASFFVALNHTSVANVLFMQALAPILAAGVALMVGGPGRPSALGLGLSLVMSASFAGMIVLTRHHREVSMAPATFISQLLVLAVAA